MATQAHALPARSEIPDEFKWRLEDIYPDEEAWEADFQAVKDLLPEVEAYKGRLAESGQRLLGCLQLQDRISQLHEKLYVYAHMRRDEDSTVPRYQALADRAESLGVQVAAALAFVVPEILTIPNETLAQWLQQVPGLDVYRHFLEDIGRLKPHTLSTREEELLAQASELAQAPRNIFGMINDADIKFPTIVDEHGREVELTKGRYIQFLESRDRRVRRDAFQALYATYARQRNTLAATLHASVKKDVFFARVRRYGSALEAALAPDNVPVSVYTNLIQVVREHLPLLHRYLALRRRLLQLDELHMYDLYVPIVPEVKMEIPFAQAVAVVQEALHPLGPEYVKVLGEGLRSRWIDVYENRGKRSGAYSWGAYGTHPYVLMNWQDNVHNLFTLAHEMGHAMHTHFSQLHQPYVYAHYTIFVAEVASTLNEALLMEHLLKTLTDQRQRLYILNHYLEEFRGTVFRQTMFAEFEKWTHEAVEAGEALTADLLGEKYLELNRTYLGDGVVLDPEIELEWARIPHFYSAFYVYKYATGFSAAVALAKRILSEGEPAVQRYLRFLSSGSSDYPIELLRQAGVDMATPEPVREGLQLFGRLLQQMEEEVARLGEATL